MKFYDCRPAPNPRRVRMLIAEKALEIETIELDLRAGAHFAPEYRALNPRATTPLLVLEDGVALREASVINGYLDARFPEPNLTGRDAQERAVIAMWEREMETMGLFAVAECFRNSAKGFVDRALPGPTAIAQIADLAERGRRRVRLFYEELDARLAESAHVAGERFTVADITAFVTVDFAERAIKEAPDPGAAHIARWRAGVAARPSAGV